MYVDYDIFKLFKNLSKISAIAFFKYVSVLYVNTLIWILFFTLLGGDLFIYQILFFLFLSEEGGYIGLLATFYFK